MRNEPIYLLLNSGGGSVSSGGAICDAMRNIQSEVVTINLGLAASMASLVLASGTKGRRYGMLHSSVLLHQPFGRSVGNVEDILSQVMQIRETTQAIERSYLKNSRESETLTALAR